MEAQFQWCSHDPRPQCCRHSHRSIPKLWALYILFAYTLQYIITKCFLKHRFGHPTMLVDFLSETQWFSNIHGSQGKWAIPEPRGRSLILASKGRWNSMGSPLRRSTLTLASSSDGPSFLAIYFSISYNVDGGLWIPMSTPNEQCLKLRSLKSLQVRWTKSGRNSFRMGIKWPL